MLRRFISLQLFAILLAMCLGWGCSNQENKTPSHFENWMQQNSKVKVLSTTAMIDDIVSQIGKQRIDHIVLISGEIDPHSYELVKGDDEKLKMAQVIFYNGLGLEHGASLRYQLEHHRNAVAVGEAILSQAPAEVIYVDGQMDPHVWMDIRLWSMIVDPILDALIKLDPEGKLFYEENAKLLKELMLVQHQKIQLDFQTVPAQKRYLVTSHDAFNYFARSYLRAPDEVAQDQWMKRFDAPEGLSPDGQLSTTDIQNIIHHLCKYQIHIVFPESNVSKDSLKKIVHACRQKGLEVKISPHVLYGDAVGNKESGADTYLKMIRHDADVLIEAWNHEPDQNFSKDCP